MSDDFTLYAGLDVSGKTTHVDVVRGDGDSGHNPYEVPLPCFSIFTRAGFSTAAPTRNIISYIRNKSSNKSS